MEKKVKLILVFLALALFISFDSYADESWFTPTFGLKETFEDNIFLTRTNEESDFITTVSPGIMITPKLGKHKLRMNLYSDLNFFNEYHSQNTYNHTADTDLLLNFTNFQVNFDNRYRYFADRSGAEDVNRVPRLQDHASLGTTFNFNKLDFTLRYLYQYEFYRTTDAIGSFLGEPLTYKDLNRQENAGEIELAFKLWPKTALLLSGDYGVLEHKTGKKSDSEYYDILIGARGEPTAKSIVEAKIGYRSQDYEDNVDGFDSVVFYGSLVENFTANDALRLDFVRTTTDTIFTDNAYYEITFIGLGYDHSFTERLLAGINFSYQLDAYPIATTNTDTGSVDEREDDVWKAGARLSYELPVGVNLELKYEHTIRDSNFSAYDYKNNLVSLGANIAF